jgi:hypothetical protein
MALVNAQKGYIGEAVDDLEAADVLDPAGHYSKAPLGPGERPLIPKKRHFHQRRRGVPLGTRTVSLVRTAADERDGAVSLV